MTITEQSLSQHLSTEQKEIVVAASAMLANSSVGELRLLRVDRREDMLQLSGQVRSFYHKQLAQEAVRTVAGDMRVDNRVSVRSPLPR